MVDDLPTSLDALRAAIDAVDDEILALLWRRAGLAAEVGKRKEVDGDTPFYVPSREAAIIRRLLERHQQCRGRARLPDAAVHGIFREVIGACLALEHPLTVAFLGPEGTFSHLAACRHFGSAVRYLPCGNFSQVFSQVERGQAAYGVVPVENTLEGAVTQTLDLLCDHAQRIRICAEIQLEIHHHLFSYAESLAEIRQVVSHPQPLAQCRGWLEEYLPQVEWIEAPSTVEGARMICDARDGTGHGGAIDWRHAAAIGPYSIVDCCDLNLLQRNIEDRRDNTTRFCVIGSHDACPSGRDKTALVLSIRDEPGALYALIRPFAKRDIGLTRIESRPARTEPWTYLFFVDVEGHRTDPALVDALDEIAAMPTARVRILGSYPAARPL
ncbi:MAG: prephenate dehydratase [Zetaproteobacteria bacterium]|nr:MAG: prephenate dehydratase [Zetaproteobacteria bacterium]